MDDATGAAPLSTGASAGDLPTETPNEVVVEFSIEPEDIPKLERLIQIHGAGDRDAFLREAIRVMAARDRAVRLQHARTDVGLPAPPESE